MTVRRGIDVAWATPSVPQIKATGAEWVARYFSTDASKNLTASEVREYEAAGLGIVTVWETTTGRATAGYAAGQADARAAEAQRKAVGLPDTHVHHFAVDEDASWSAVQPYFDGAISVLGLPRVGCYGGIRVIEGAHGHGIRYLWQTVAWSAGQWAPYATIRQTGGTVLSGGADIDYAETPDFGQTPRPAAPQEIDMDATQAKQLADLHALLFPYGGWDYRNADQDAASVKAGHGHIPDAYGYLVGASTAVQHLTAQVAALTAAVGALAKGGGLTAEQITAAAKVGADEALAELGRALDGTQAPKP